MSYLGPLRLHFAGKFQAAPSTVNNDPLHYNNQNFKPSYQQPSTGNRPSQMNGWWNPTGDAVWRLIGCQITSAWMHAPVPPSDPALACIVADSDQSVSGKLVDLDPEQQLVSEIWGMQVRIATAEGVTLLRSRYRVAPFHDIWNRAPGGGDLIAGAAYQSVLYDLEWGGIDSSPFLRALREASAASGKLSIKFNVDGYNMLPASPDFTLGRIVGTIGPCAEGEPEHLVVGRHFNATDAGGGFFVPTGKINFCPAVVDPEAGKIYLDLGNALPTAVSGGDISNLGTLTLGYTGAASGAIEQIAYQPHDWYRQTAGVVEVPAGRKLTSAEWKAIASSPLTLTLADAGRNIQGGVGEPADGLYARADRLVFRLSPGDTAEVQVFASRFGQPYAGARVIAFLDPSQLQPSSMLGPAPTVASPIDAIAFPARVDADRDGRAILPIRASDPGNPRSFIDGQVYGVRAVLEETLEHGSGSAGSYNPWDFVSLLVFSGFTADDPPTWYGALQPIFQQYANLYPVMKDFLDLAHYESVCANAGLLALAFGLPLEDPNSMPVTRDLSPAKRAAILRWLAEPGADGRPRKGIPAAAAIASAAGAVAVPIAPVSDEPDDTPLRGGKASAVSRRIAVRRRT
jgi:hypothetical protein